MMNCLNELSFSETHSRKRLAKAHRVFGRAVVHRIVGFALFLLGARREDIAQALSLPLGTFFSFLNRASRSGTAAFVDQRTRPTPQPPIREPGLTVTLRVEEEAIHVVFNDDSTVTLPKADPLQCKTVLLCLVNAKLLSPQQVSQALGLSERRIRALKSDFLAQGSPALFDQRCGQQKDYRVTPEIKAEIVQQFVVNVVAARKTSGHRLAEDLRDRCALHVSPRTIRLHTGKLGLRALRESLPALLESVKKNC
jgi:hypothetical protein